MKNLALLILFAAACGGSDMLDAREYRDVALQISASVDRHRTNGQGAADAAACRSEHDRYEAEVRPLLDSMSGMSGQMDSWMRCLGRGPAGMEQGCVSMRSELDRHALAGCANDAGANRDELNRHCDAMSAFATSEADAASVMMGAAQCGGSMMSCDSCGH